MFNDRTFPIPPSELSHWAGHGQGDTATYLAIGEGWWRFLIEIGICRNPEPRTVLDVGCGTCKVGRNFSLLSELELFQGFDVHKPQIDWCKEHIEPYDERFKFDWFDFRAEIQNPDGKLNPGSWKGRLSQHIEGHPLPLMWEPTLPYPDDHFDVILIQGVFTAMDPLDIFWLLRQCGRLLKPETGRLVVSYNRYSRAKPIIEGGLRQLYYGNPSDGEVQYDPRAMSLMCRCAGLEFLVDMIPLLICQQVFIARRLPPFDNAGGWPW